MRPKLLAVATLVFVTPFSSLFASSFSQLVAFGDSLSDNGNAFLLTGGVAPGANYGTHTFPGGLTTSYFSDGTNTTPAAAGPQGLWIDQLAGKLGLADPLPSAAGGSNYAIGSAMTGTAQPQDVGNQVGLYLTSHPVASSTALFTFWAGANDIFGFGNPVQAADNISQEIAALHGQGADNFVWLNLPLLGDTPDGSIARAALNGASLLFNQEWAADVAALQASGIHVVGVDIGSLFSKIIGDPASYGFSNVTTPAQGANLPTDAGYLFWDGAHPTEAGHALVADAVASALSTSAAPEPASLGIVFCGALGLLAVARKRLFR